MPDVSDAEERASFLEHVHRALLNPRFRTRLTVSDRDGTHPIAVALRGDAIDAMASDVRDMGGAANVAVPLLDGMVVFAMTLGVRDERAHGGDRQDLRGDATVGVLIQRLIDDGGSATYIINTRREHRSGQSARAGDARVFAGA